MIIADMATKQLNARVPPELKAEWKAYAARRGCKEERMTEAAVRLFMEMPAALRDAAMLADATTIRRWLQGEDAAVERAATVIREIARLERESSRHKTKAGA